MSEDEATFRVIQKRWQSSCPGVELNTQAWEIEANRKKVLEDIQLGVKAACEACGFTMKIQQEKIGLKVADLVSAAHGKDFYPVSLPDPKFQPSIFPVWRELVDIYADEHKLVRLVCYDKGSKETLELEDYCFAGPRKAGGWYSSLSEARSKDPCKSIVFGVEICADHADERLQFINKKSPIGIDIQLVPSAGMRPKYDADAHGVALRSTAMAGTRNRIMAAGASKSILTVRRRLWERLVVTMSTSLRSIRTRWSCIAARHSCQSWSRRGRILRNAK